jgi:tetratricopeptide (TPR) repeat protein
MLWTEMLAMESQVPLKAGRNLSDSFYIERYGITQEAIKSGVYLKNLTKKEVIACIYSNRASLRMESLQYVRSVEERDQIIEKFRQDIEQSLDLHPLNVLAKRSKAQSMSLYDENHKGAIDLLLELKELDPTATTLKAISDTYSSSGDYKAALEYLSLAETAKDFSDTIHAYLPFYRAGIYYDWKRYDKSWSLQNALF